MFHHIDIAYWVSTIGYLGIFLVILFETGVFFGFFLPGDSLLFTAGLLASQKVFNIAFLVPSLVVIAILGYTFAYWFGKKMGHWLLRRKDSIWFKKSYYDQAEKFYGKHGGKALILGRLMPIVRTFVPIVAGVVQMPYRRYVMFNVAGALIWCAGITLMGYYLGNLVPNASRYVFLIVLLIVFASISPAIWHVCKRWCVRGTFRA